MKTALIIPAYKPGKEMLELLERFRGNEDFCPVVVDDGSGEQFREIFDAVPDFAVLLRHEVNRGKGTALKTAIAHVLEKMPECGLALTADADGQHRYEDIVMVNESARQHPDELILGSRKFEGDVPFRSRFGNGVTRKVFALASGQKVYDTQTGLRVFGRAAMERFLKVPGERYEYEINMLLDAAKSGMNIREETIATVYLNDNESSHFNPLKDSIKIYMCILKFSFSSMLAVMINFLKFCFSSVLAFVIDFVMLLLLNKLTNALPAATSLAISVVGARLVSSAVNFCVNRNMVFKGDEKLGKALAKYALLALFILVANYILMHLLTIILDWNMVISKVLVEVALFTVSFFVQRKFVYRKK